MYFTQEDYIKIHNWLKANSVRDTQFVPVRLPLIGNETVAIVQNNINKQLPIKELKKSFELYTLEEFEQLSQSGKLDKNMIYGVLRDDEAVVETIYFGNIPFNIQGAQRTPKQTSPWHIDEDMHGYTDWTVDSDIASYTGKTISYLGDNIDIHFAVTREVTYQWSDGRPDTVDTEHGVVSFKTDSKDITLTRLYEEEDSFLMEVQPNMGAYPVYARTLKVTPVVYSKITKQSEELEPYTFVQGISFIHVNDSYETDSTAKTYEMNIYVAGYPASTCIPRLMGNNITITEGADAVTNTTLVATADPLTYKLMMDLTENATLEDRNIKIKITSNMEQVETETILTQKKRGTVKIKGLQLSNITAFFDGEHTLPVEGDMTVPYGQESFSIYLEPNEGYMLPTDSSYIIVEPEGISFSYSQRGAKITFNSLKQDVTKVAISAFTLGYITYDEPQVELDYPDTGNSGEGTTTSYNTFTYSVNQVKHFTDVNGREFTTSSRITTGAQVEFTFKAYDMSNNAINEVISPTATINPTSGLITWKTNGTGQNKRVTVTVKVTFEDTDSDRQKHSTTKQDDIIQPYATRTVTLNTAQSTGVNMSIMNGYNSSVSYGGNIKITITPKAGYDIPDSLNNKFNILPVNGYGDASYVKSGNTGTLTIANITSNITVEVDGIAQEVVTLPVYIGKLTPVESGFTSKAQAIVPNITYSMIDTAIRNGNINAVENLPRTASNPCTIDISTQRSYLIGLVPLNGDNSGYIMKQYNGVTGYDPFDYGGNSNYFSNGSDIKIGNENYKLFAVYSNPNVNNNEVISYRVTIEK